MLSITDREYVEGHRHQHEFCGHHYFISAGFIVPGLFL